MNQTPFYPATLLVVDDTPANLNLLTQILVRQGYKVRVAPHGRLALQSAQSSPPDLILLDVKMPDMDGYEVCRHLKSDEQTRQIPVIFISALDAAFDKVTAFGLGATDYITKPFELTEVIARIQNQLKLRQFQLQLQAQNAQLQLLLATTQAISNALDVQSALQAILANICQTMGWDCAEAWMPTPDEKALECCSFWSIQVQQCLSELEPTTQIYSIISYQHLLGRVWLSKSPEWIEKIEKPEDCFHLVCQKYSSCHLQSALGIPILFDNQVLAILIFLCNKSVAMNERSLELVKAVATQLGSMIKRKKAESALIQANLELERLATLDGLTQIANRRRFDEYFSREWQTLFQQQKPLSLILFDIDYFKRYNDFYGHQSGDECLKKVAKAIDLIVSYPPNLLARYGGEEFAVIMPNTSLEQACQMAQEIHQYISNLNLPHQASKISDRLTLSLGVASLIPNTEQEPACLIAIADKALYEAKNQGRDRIIALNSDSLTLIMTPISLQS